MKKNKCNIHKRYQAKYRPRVLCPNCWATYLRADTKDICTLMNAAYKDGVLTLAEDFGYYHQGRN